MKKILLLATALMTAAAVGTHTYAEVLGDVLNEYTNDMGAYSVFHKTEFDGGNVGKQTEYYVEYSPNSEAVPVIAYDGSLWGQSNINTVHQTEQDNGYRTVAGINGDFFSFKTGLPMGTSISRGRILASEASSQPAIGFRDNGTAFIDDLQIKTTAIKDGTSVDIMCINKWYQSGFDPIYMLTDDFGETSETNGECLFVICSKVQGDVKIDSNMTVRVDESFVYNGEITIPKGKIMLIIDNAFGMEHLKSFMQNLAVGDEFTIRYESINSEKGLWKDAAEATSSIGGRLLKNGEVGSSLDSSAEPRTAIGIKADGNVIMYTLDGRQSGYSYGARLITLANRMKEIGCVDAINLDGGGSTTMGVLLSGTDDFSIANSPSDKYLRSVANYIFLRDKRNPTGIPWIVNASDLSSVYYLGDTAKILIESIYDTNNYKMEDMSAMNVLAENAEISEDGTISFNNIGNVRILLSGGIFEKEYGITVHRIYFDDIAGHWAENIVHSVSDLELINGISENGTTMFKPDNRMTRAEFAAIISRFMKLDFSEYETVQLPFSDAASIQEWAIPAVKSVYGAGVMNGKSDDGGQTLRFEPDSQITRAEAMTLLSRILVIEDYSETAFADDNDIPDWARDGITRLVSSGVIKGYDDNTIRPNAHITRAEGAAMLYNTGNYSKHE